MLTYVKCIQKLLGLVNRLVILKYIKDCGVAAENLSKKITILSFFTFESHLRVKWLI